MIAVFFLILLAVAYRLIMGMFIQHDSTWLANFVPLAAIAFCGAVYLPAKYKFAVPLLALFISDVILNSYYFASILNPDIVGRYFALVLVGALGLLLQNRASLKTLLPASLVGSAIFYLISNIFSWLSDPGYVKNFAGLIQALTTGLPAYSATPSWMFFRNSLVSDFIFTAVCVLCVNFARSRERLVSTSPLPRAA